MDESVVENARQVAEMTASNRLAHSAELADELEVCREFTREMAAPWHYAAEHLSERNVGLLDSPMLSELETATTRALIRLEERIVAIEKALELR